MRRRIYVASSWRNPKQPIVVRALRAAGHEVYDFRHPEPGNSGFSWGELIPQRHREAPPAEVVKAALASEKAARGFSLDYGAMLWANACVMVQPCGRSAALELGWFCGVAMMHAPDHVFARPLTIALLADGCEPELMLKLADHVVTSLDDVIAILGRACEHPDHVQCKAGVPGCAQGGAP